MITPHQRQLVFRELMYVDLISSLSEQGLPLSPSQKQEMYRLLVRRPGQFVRLCPLPDTPRQELELDLP